VDRGRPDYSRVVVAIADISERKRAELALVRLIESKDQFIATVSHELRTPLTTVVGLAEELREHRSRFSDHEIDEFISLIASESSELADIVEDLLVAARADIGTIALACRDIDVADLTKQLVSDMRHQGHDAVAVEATGNPRAWADPIRVRQIVRNLLTNAFRYGGGDVRVTTSSNGRMLHVEVSDDGEGVPAESVERIFEPYIRLAKTDAPTGSVGIGLTVSRSLARLMNGDLRYSRIDGRTVFRLGLPRHADSPDPETEAAPPGGVFTAMTPAGVSPRI
jgi:two-component system sensor histidine kinase MtrB